MFTAALFIIAKIWNQPKCPSVTDWIKKMQHIYTMEYYAAIKKDEFVSFVGTHLLSCPRLKHRTFWMIEMFCIFKGGGLHG
uniref:Uncharacterized protein n=1 Tax=Macaca nemestrina TaxID=9545 RepID=A0A2K6BE40_MACNE